MKLYRLERNGWGVFCAGSEVNLPYSPDAIYAQRGFTCEDEYHCNENWRSACMSIKDLKTYFGSDFKCALEQGASIVEYNVHKAHVRFGFVEVAFNIHKVRGKKIILQGKDGGNAYESKPCMTVRVSGKMYTVSNFSLTI